MNSKEKIIVLLIGKGSLEEGKDGAKEQWRVIGYLAMLNFVRENQELDVLSSETTTLIPMGDVRALMIQGIQHLFGEIVIS